MPYLTDMTSKIARFEGDPKIVSTGPSSLSAADRLGKALGWFSFGLGLAELIAPRQITRALGMEGKEELVRAYGAREIGAGILCLSIDKPLGLWNRVAGDGIDIATLLTGMGFFETVTFSFTTPKEAELFMPRGLAPLMVDDANLYLTSPFASCFHLILPLMWFVDLNGRIWGVGYVSIIAPLGQGASLSHQTQHILIV